MTTQEKIRKIISEHLNVKIAPMDVTFESMGADYKDILLIIMDIEGAFKIKILDEEIEKITTLGEAIKCVESKCK